MVYLFLFPLIGGVLPYAGIGFINKLCFPGRVALNLYNSGIATLTVGGCFKGVLEIYGTTSDYILFYWIAGIALTISGVAIYIFSMAKQSKNI
ncbi:hypothetical protein SDC9_138290 [bioreactor metagenome]|uniref:Major facilitator superfamily (MFS) profile domain-containing protein n=1 Tax=bioreactor metagenome TaxID=1076179 RepID=A0A645DR23_9ZZZZ